MNVFFCFSVYRFQLCLALLLVSAHAAEDKKSAKKKAEPLEKKLDKRGLFNLGYGYGINGLDIGYVPQNHHGVYHESAPVYESHYGHHGYHAHHAPHVHLGHKVDVHKTITKTVGVPVPYEVSFDGF